MSLYEIGGILGYSMVPYTSIYTVQYCGSVYIAATRPCTRALKPQFLEPEIVSTYRNHQKDTVRHNCAEEV